ncbi:MAG: hypothetical protein ABIO88_08490 [Burkholderiaceae bacterium]
MFDKTTVIRYCSQALGGALLALLSVTAYSAEVADNATANYKNEIAACKNESPKSVRAACIAEANKTLSDYRRGTESYQQTLRSNALQRCNAFKGDDRRDCESRLRGEGNADGSVAEGGILRETVTTVPVN